MQTVIEYLNIETGEVSELLSTNVRMSTPTWFPDCETLLSNVYGRLHQFSRADPRLKLVDTQYLNDVHCDYGLSPNGMELALTNKCSNGVARIYIRDMQTGEVRVVVNQSPAWFHGWSPDGTHLIYVCVRNNQWTIAQTRADGSGKEQIVLRSDEFSSTILDGPEFSPDGRYIWFSSDRSGTMELWRQELATGESEQMTDDIGANFFPHPSPDGAHVCFLKKKCVRGDWREDGMVELWLLSSNEKNPIHLRTVYGGKGTLNLPSWSPAGDGFAYARYS